MDLEMVLSQINQKGWNVYPAKRASIIDRVRHGPITSLVENTEYVLYPKVDKPQDLMSIRTAVMSLMGRGIYPQIEHDGQPYAMRHIEFKEEKVYVKGVFEEELSYASFEKALETLSSL